MGVGMGVGYVVRVICKGKVQDGAFRGNDIMG